MRFSNSLTFAALLTLMVLTGCGKHDAANQVATNPAKVADIAAAAAHPRAGRWETSVTINHMDMPGMAPQMRAAMDSGAMQRGMAGGSAIATCLTPEKAAHPGAEFFSARHNDCAYDTFTMTGGKLDAVMHCTGPSMHMTSTMSGTYDETSFAIHGTSQVQMPGGQAMSQDMTEASKWVGPCTGTEVNAGPKG